MGGEGGEKKIGSARPCERHDGTAAAYSYSSTGQTQTMLRWRDESLTTGN